MGKNKAKNRRKKQRGKAAAPARPKETFSVSFFLFMAPESFEATPAVSVKLDMDENDLPLKRQEDATWVAHWSSSSLPEGGFLSYHYTTAAGVESRNITIHIPSDQKKTIQLDLFHPGDLESVLETFLHDSWTSFQQTWERISHSMRREVELRAVPVEEGSVDAPERQQWEACYTDQVIVQCAIDAIGNLLHKWANSDDEAVLTAFPVALAALGELDPLYDRLRLEETDNLTAEMNEAATVLATCCDIALLAHQTSLRAGPKMRLSQSINQLRPMWPVMCSVLEEHLHALTGVSPLWLAGCSFLPLIDKSRTESWWIPDHFKSLRDLSDFLLVPKSVEQAPLFAHGKGLEGDEDALLQLCSQPTIECLDQLDAVFVQRCLLFLSPDAMPPFVERLAAVCHGDKQFDSALYVISSRVAAEKKAHRSRWIAVVTRMLSMIDSYSHTAVLHDMNSLHTLSRLSVAFPSARIPTLSPSPTLSPTMSPILPLPLMTWKLGVIAVAQNPALANLHHSWELDILSKMIKDALDAVVPWRQTTVPLNLLVPLATVLDTMRHLSTIPYCLIVMKKLPDVMNTMMRSLHNTLLKQWGSTPQHCVHLLLTPMGPWTDHPLLRNQIMRSASAIVQSCTVKGQVQQLVKCLSEQKNVAWESVLFVHWLKEFAAQQRRELLAGEWLFWLYLRANSTLCNMLPPIAPKIVADVCERHLSQWQKALAELKQKKCSPLQAHKLWNQWSTVERMLTLHLDSISVEDAESVLDIKAIKTDVAEAMSHIKYFECVAGLYRRILPFWTYADKETKKEVSACLWHSPHPNSNKPVCELIPAFPSYEKDRQYLGMIYLALKSPIAMQLLKTVGESNEASQEETSSLRLLMVSLKKECQEYMDGLLDHSIPLCKLLGFSSENREQQLEHINQQIWLISTLGTDCPSLSLTSIHPDGRPDAAFVFPGANSVDFPDPLPERVNELSMVVDSIRFSDCASRFCRTLRVIFPQCRDPAVAALEGLCNFMGSKEESTIPMASVMEQLRALSEAMEMAELQEKLNQVMPFLDHAADSAPLLDWLKESTFLHSGDVQNPAELEATEMHFTRFYELAMGNIEKRHLAQAVADLDRSRRTLLALTQAQPTLTDFLSVCVHIAGDDAPTAGRFIHGAVSALALLKEMRASIEKSSGMTALDRLLDVERNGSLMFRVSQGAFPVAIDEILQCHAPQKSYSLVELQNLETQLTILVGGFQQVQTDKASADLQDRITVLNAVISRCASYAGLLMELKSLGFPPFVINEVLREINYAEVLETLTIHYLETVKSQCEEWKRTVRRLQAQHLVLCRVPLVATVSLLRPVYLESAQYDRTILYADPFGKDGPAGFMPSLAQGSADAVTPIETYLHALSKIGLAKYQQGTIRPKEGIMDRGQPTLFLAGSLHQNDPLTMVLDIYRHAVDRFPFDYELLVCTPETTAEDIDRFILHVLSADNVLKNSVFAVTGPNLLPQQLQYHFAKTLDDWSQPDHMHPHFLAGVRLRKHYRLAIVVSGQESSGIGQFAEHYRRKTGESRIQRVEGDLGQWVQDCLARQHRRVLIATSHLAGMGCTRYLHKQLRDNRLAGKRIVLDGNVNANCFKKTLVAFENARTLESRLFSLNTDTREPACFIQVHSSATGPLNEYFFLLLIVNSLPQPLALPQRCAGPFYIEIAEEGCEGSIQRHFPLARLLPTAHLTVPADALPPLPPGHCRVNTAMDSYHAQSGEVQTVCNILNAIAADPQGFDVNDTTLVSPDFRPHKERAGRGRGYSIGFRTLLGPRERSAEEGEKIMLSASGCNRLTWTRLRSFWQHLAFLFTCTRRVSRLTSEQKRIAYCLGRDAAVAALRKVSHSSALHGDAHSLLAVEEADNGAGVAASQPVCSVIQATDRSLPEDDELLQLLHGLAHPAELLTKNADFAANTPSELLDVLRSSLKMAHDRVQQKGAVADLSMLMALERLQSHGSSTGQLPAGFESYVLTHDLVKKMLAVQTLLMSSVPVIMIGETGCGKTAMIRLLCALQNYNLIQLRIHGGYDAERVVSEITDAIRQAKMHYESYSTRVRHVVMCLPDMLISFVSQEYNRKSIIFLDEVNTCSSLGLIKELLCDHSLNGVSCNDICARKSSSKRRVFNSAHVFAVVAAANPYRFRTEAELSRFERIGLHTGVMALDDSMTKLLYRVHPLPPTLIQFVWDFGSMEPHVELSCIRYKIDEILGSQSRADARDFAHLVAVCHRFMHSVDSDCRYVSFRDAENAAAVYQFFHESKGILSTEENKEQRCIALAVAVCYMAKLDDRSGFLRVVDASEVVTAAEMLEYFETERMHVASATNVPAGIVLNEALTENIFIMTIAVQLRIPLFLIGDPGTSKSLAKTIVSNSMLGERSGHPLFQRMKPAHFFTFQCSPQMQTKDLEEQFRLVEQVQDHDSEDNIIVLVLEEAGLAEMSPDMPLKILHERFDKITEERNLGKRGIAFIAMSNWSLDPAKMNRGIFMTRGIPTLNDLVFTALDICAVETGSAGETEPDSQRALIAPVLRSLANAFLEVTSDMRLQNNGYSRGVFFALRDFYSCCKLIAREVLTAPPSVAMVAQAIARNFSGLPQSEQERVDAIFAQNLQSSLMESEDQLVTASPVLSTISQSVLDRIKNAFEDPEHSRFPLVVHHDPSAAIPLMTSLEIIPANATVLFGSAFVGDRSTSQICRVLGSIRLCLEGGHTVVLACLNMLYESLYDVLNKYYIRYGGQQFVDIGLGFHRVKTTVHPNFRMIVIAPPADVYERFPAPLLNRFETQSFTVSSVLTAPMLVTLDRVSAWMSRLEKASRSGDTGQLFEDLFLGHGLGLREGVASLIFARTQNQAVQVVDEAAFTERTEEESFVAAMTPIQDTLLLTTSNEGLIRLPDTEFASLAARVGRLTDRSSLVATLREMLSATSVDENFFITTRSFACLPKDIAEATNRPMKKAWTVECLNVHNFDTEADFFGAIQRFLETSKPCVEDGVSATHHHILIVQVDSSKCQTGPDLLRSVEYLVRNARSFQYPEGPPEFGRQFHHIAVVVYLSRNEQEDPGWKGLRASQICRTYDSFWHHLDVDDIMVPEGFVCDPLAVASANQSVSGLIASLVSSHDQDETAIEVDRVLPLLEYAIPFAVNRVDFPQPGGQHVSSNDRIHLLRTLLAHEGNHRLLRVFVRRIVAVLQSIEEQKAENGADWLRRIVSNPALFCSGSLISSASSYVTGRVIGALARLIATWDCHHGLQVLSGSSSVADFVQRVWCGIAGDVAVSPAVHISSSLPVPRAGLLQSYAADVFKAESSAIETAQFPFSWFFHQKIEDAAKAIEGTPTVDGVLALLSDNPLCVVLWAEGSSLTAEQSETLCLHYLHDVLCYCPLRTAIARNPLVMDALTEILSPLVLTHLEEASSRVNSRGAGRLLRGMIGSHLALKAGRDVWVSLCTVLDITPVLARTVRPFLHSLLAQERQHSLSLTLLRIVDHCAKTQISTLLAAPTNVALASAANNLAALHEALQALIEDHDIFAVPLMYEPNDVGNQEPLDDVSESSSSASDTSSESSVYNDEVDVQLPQASDAEYTARCQALQSLHRLCLSNMLLRPLLHCQLPYDWLKYVHRFDDALQRRLSSSAEEEDENALDVVKDVMECLRRIGTEKEAIRAGGGSNALLFAFEECEQDLILMLLSQPPTTQVLLAVVHATAGLSNDHAFAHACWLRFLQASPDVIQSDLAPPFLPIMTRDNAEAAASVRAALSQCLSDAETANIAVVLAHAIEEYLHQCLPYRGRVSTVEAEACIAEILKHASQYFGSNSAGDQSLSQLIMLAQLRLAIREAAPAISQAHYTITEPFARFCESMGLVRLAEFNAYDTQACNAIPAPATLLLREITAVAGGWASIRGVMQSTVLQKSFPWITDIVEATATSACDIFFSEGPELESALSGRECAGESAPSLTTQAVAAFVRCFAHPDFASTFMSEPSVNLLDSQSKQTLRLILGLPQLRTMLLEAEKARDIERQHAISLVIHLGMAISCSGRCSPPIRALLDVLSSGSRTIQLSYLPGVPHDIQAESIDAVKDKTSLWRCKRGHLYTIGDCGAPNQISRCAECGAEIGGSYTGPVGNARKINAGDIEKTIEERGYCLSTADIQHPEPIRGMNVEETTIIQIIVHALLMLAAIEDDSALVRNQSWRCGPASQLSFCSSRELVQLLVGRVQTQMQHLAHLLDDQKELSLLVLHTIASHMDHTAAKNAGQMNALVCSQVFANKDGRKKWEEDFLNLFVRPILKNPHRMTRAVAECIQTHQGCVTLMTGLAHPQPWHNLPDVHWMTLVRASNQFAGAEGTTQLITQDDQWLDLVVALPSIAAGIEWLMKRAQLRSAVTVRELLDKEEPCAQKMRNEAGIGHYLDAINRLRRENTPIPSEGSHKSAQPPEVSMDSQAAMLLPTPQTKEGLACSRTIRRLVNIHNELVMSERRSLGLSEAAASYEIDFFHMRPIHALRLPDFDVSNVDSVVLSKDEGAGHVIMQRAKGTANRRFAASVVGFRPLIAPIPLMTEPVSSCIAEISRSIPQQGLSMVHQMQLRRELRASLHGLDVASRFIRTCALGAAVSSQEKLASMSIDEYASRRLLMKKEPGGWLDIISHFLPSLSADQMSHLLSLLFVVDSELLVKEIRWWLSAAAINPPDPAAMWSSTPVFSQLMRHHFSVVDDAFKKELAPDHIRLLNEVARGAPLEAVCLVAACLRGVLFGRLVRQEREDDYLPAGAMPLCDYLYVAVDAENDEFEQRSPTEAEQALDFTMSLPRDITMASAVAVYVDLIAVFFAV